MAKLTLDEKMLDDYVFELMQLDTPDDIKRAVYVGAGIVADAVKANIKALPVTNARGTPEKPIDGVTQPQKDGLLKGFGIARMQIKNGYVNVKLGFDGYNRTKKKGGGYQPNALIARSVEGGTTFRKPHPFVQPAVAKTRAACEAAMSKELDRAISLKIKK